LSSRNIE